jgi:hypothetical protein
MSIENTNDFIGVRTGDFQASSTVVQPPTLLRAPN